MQLTYAETIKVLCVMHHIREDAEAAFRARLRKLQAVGIPEGANPGKGKRVDYNAEMLIELALAVELIQVGLQPRQIETLIKGNRADLVVASLYALTHSKAGIVLILSPHALREMTAWPDNEADYIGAISFVSSKRFAELLADPAIVPVIGADWRWVSIRMNEMVATLFVCLEEVLGYDERETRRYLVELLEQYHGRFKTFKSATLNKVTAFVEAGDGNP